MLLDMSNKVVKYLKERKYVLIIALIFFFIRLPLLDQMYLLHDERDIVLSGYTIAKSGQDLYGNSFPLRFDGISPKNPVGAIYYSALWWLFLPERSVFYARLPYVFISSLLILILYELIFQITKDKKKAIITAVIFCFSPWIYHLSRLAMDINLAFPLLLIGMILYLRKKIAFSFIFFILSSYTYLGFRVLTPLLIFYLSFYFVWANKEKKSLSSLIKKNILFIIILIASIFLIDKNITSSRVQNELLFSRSQRVIEDVHIKRMTSIAPEKVRAIFHNKITSSFDILFENILSGFELSYLFKKGDYSAVNGNTAAGQFFMPFIIFLIAGIISAAQRKKTSDLFIIGFIIVGMLPSLASVISSSYSIRAILSGVGYAYTMSLGVIYMYEYFQKKNMVIKAMFYSIFLVLMIINIVFFGYNYFLRRPITVSELFNEHERTLANYLISQTGKTTVFHTYPQEVYLTYAFLNKKITAPEIRLAKERLSPLSDFTFTMCLYNRNFLNVNPKIVYDGCLTEAQYKEWVTNDIAQKKLLYKNYSLKTAYFVFE